MRYDSEPVLREIVTDRFGSLEPGVDLLKITRPNIQSVKLQDGESGLVGDDYVLSLQEDNEGRRVLSVALPGIVPVTSAEMDASEVPQTTRSVSSPKEFGTFPIYGKDRAQVVFVGANSCLLVPEFDPQNDALSVTLKTVRRRKFRPITQDTKPLPKLDLIYSSRIKYRLSTQGPPRS